MRRSRTRSPRRTAAWSDGAGWSDDTRGSWSSHGDWHGTAVGSGLVSHEAEVGVQIRVYKMVAVDLSWLLLSRSVTIAKQYAQEETAAVGDFATGGGISVGAVF